jgi:hypothetical protein
MAAQHEIRASYDRESIVIYQAYAPAIADPALREQTFVSPFSFNRMTWIKPSFLWLMYRSNWAQKKGQQRILAVHISRKGWEKALAEAVLTHPEPSLYANALDWKIAFEQSRVHVQWDTERSFRGVALNHLSIQVGISRHLIDEYVNDWIIKIEDLTKDVTKMRDLIRSGKTNKAKRFLPHERAYPLSDEIAKRLLIA